CRLWTSSGATSRPEDQLRVADIICIRTGEDYSTWPSSSTPAPGGWRA
ncbi:MAG: hypothetical protein AVDCRST_MAG14-2411, partial [uncultured Rubrobacteraceae bacterium]